MEKKIDWTNIKFIPKEGEWFIPECICNLLVDYSQWKENTKIEDGMGLFEGLTNQTFSTFSGELPRVDEEGCPFDEFIIYYNDQIINDLTFLDLIKLQE